MILIAPEDVEFELESRVEASELAPGFASMVFGSNQRAIEGKLHVDECKVCTLFIPVPHMSVSFNGELLDSKNGHRPGQDGKMIELSMKDLSVSDAPKLSIAFHHCESLMIDWAELSLGHTKQYATRRVDRGTVEFLSLIHIFWAFSNMKRPKRWLMLPRSSFTEESLIRALIRSSAMLLLLSRGMASLTRGL